MLLCIFIFCSPIYSQNIFPLYILCLEEFNLIGPVKHLVISRTYGMDIEFIEGVIFNKEGLIMEYYSPCVEGDCTKMNYYHEYNKVTIEILFCLPRSLRGEIMLKYNDAGLITEMTTLYGMVWTYTYYEDGIEVSNEDGCRFYEYDEEGCFIYSEECRDEIHYYKYDKNHKLIQMQKYGKDSNLIHEYSYSYYPDGRLKECTYLCGSTYTVSIFDRYEACTVKKVYEDGTLTCTEEYLVEYEFDEQGNWIKQIHYDDDGPELIFTRTILYY
jgi:hypothetical protein